jgi:hypothetical protein
MTTTVSRRHGTSDGDDGDNEPVWSLELASSWARLDSACGPHALAESKPLITTALAMLPPQRSMVAHAGCVAEARSNNEQIARSLDGLPSLIPISAFATDFFPKLQADINERVNLLRFAKLGPTFSIRARPESRHFVPRLGHGALAFLASDPPTSGRLGELRDKFPEHYDAVSRIFGLPSSRIISTLRSPQLVLLAISRVKLCGVHSRRRVLTCRIMRGPLLLLTIWLDAAEMLRSTPLTLG